MKLFMLFLSLLFSCSLLSNCMSGMIVASGKSYEHLNEDDVGLKEVRGEMGEPVYRRSYDPNLPITQTPEYLRRGSRAFIWGGDDSVEEELAARCEVYVHKGPFFEPTRGQGYAMIGGMTLGIGDIIMLPTAIKERRELSKYDYSITFYYTKDMKVLGVYQGDIRDKDSDWWNVPRVQGGEQ